MMSALLSPDTMSEHIAASLAHEQQIVCQGVRREALGALHHVFRMHGELDRADLSDLLGLGDKLATPQTDALLKRGLLDSDSPHGRLRFGVPQHALRFYFPGLWPDAEAQEQC